MESIRYDVINKTWNPVIGCKHQCSYCWARRLAETKLKDTERYRDGFIPKLIEKELNRSLFNKFVFVSDMGDLFGEWVPSEWITKVIDTIKKNTTSEFLFLTKNPARYFEFLKLYPENIVFGATIESNRKYQLSDAPGPEDRYRAMVELPVPRKMVSVEPIMDFDMETMVQWMTDIDPVLVHVGYDNYNNNLVEPALAKTLQLIQKLEVFTKVKKLTLREQRRLSFGTNN
jgi:DNA repair photolyase